MKGALETARAVVVVPLLIVAPVSPLWAQSVSSASPSDGWEVLSNYDFHLSATAFANADERFWREADFGGDIDLVRCGRGRLNFLANYEVILGHEFRRFDPNQSNYTLDLTASWLVGGSEVGGLFHHVSRHLSDRTKRFPVDWNMLGLQASRLTVRGRWLADGSVRVLWTTQRSFVDYNVESGLSVSTRYTLNGRLAVIGAASLTDVRVDREVANRGTLTGSGAEVGLRLTGSGGAAELFVAFERRIDADPLDRRTRSLGLVGFRFLNK